MVGRASFQAADEIFYAERGSIGNIRHRRLDPKEKLKLVWKLYVPPALSVGVTVTAIIFANRIGSRRTTALATAYSLVERSFDQYRSSVIKNFGESGERKVRDGQAQEQIVKNPPPSNQVLVVRDNEVLFHEAYTGRYFTSDMQTVRKAVNDINAQVIREQRASLSDFYELVGLPKTAISDEIGWTTDKLLEVRYSAVLTEDSRPCISIEYVAVPIRGFDIFG